MPAVRNQIGSDTPYHTWSPINSRKLLKWPKGQRVAVVIVVAVEYAELVPPENALVPPTFVRQGPYPKLPDIHEVSPREYGNRVGLFRVLKAMDDYGIKGTAALDAAVALRYPFIIDQIKQRGWEIIGHSLVSNRMISQNMSDEEETEYIRESLEIIRRVTGEPVLGWSGVDYGQSSRTIKILAQHGIRYMCDWPNDDQPYRMTVPQGQMIALPMFHELDDSVNRARRIAIGRWAQLVCECFDQLYLDGQSQGRVLVLNIHPWITGQPYRIKAFTEILAHITKHKDVWITTGSDVVDWTISQVDTQ
jgi:peptidoglycan/xylan/chitin deacetylase (PgdA/CDA1 family)